MALGIIQVIPASQHAEVKLSGVGGGTLYRSVKILNPNDGVVYIAHNRDVLNINQGSWEWKVPSQSYAALPGPFQSVGMFYLDQSGANRQGEITVYPSNLHVDEPMFVAVGRALQAQASALDITEGTIPANPGAGIARLWATPAIPSNLHVLNSDGSDQPLAFGDLSNVQHNAGLVVKKQLDITASAPQANSLTAAVNNWAHASGQFAFGVESTGSIIWLNSLYSGFATNPNASYGLIQLAVGIDEGAAGTNVTEIYNVTMAPNVNTYFTAQFNTFLSGLSVGTHFMQIDCFFQGTGLTVTCLPGAIGHLFKGRVLEMKI